MSAPGGGVCLTPGGGVCLIWRGVSAPRGGDCSGGCFSAPGGCLLPVGCLLLGGVCSGGWWSAPGGEGCLLQGGCLLLGVVVVVSQHALRQTPLPVNRITHTCKNITLAQLRCGR